VKETLKLGIILGIICVVAAFLLAGVDIITKPKILAQTKAEEDLSLREVFKQADNFEPVIKDNETVYYKAFDKEGKVIGIAFKASAKGYSSVIESLAGVSKDGKITAIKIISQNETPGLGSRITDKSFTDKFNGVDNLSKIEAITGATISSRAVINSVNKKFEELKALVNNG